MGEAEALWNSQMSYGTGSHQMYGAGGQVTAELGFGLPLGARFVGTPRVGYSASSHGRDYRMAYALGLLHSEELRFEVVDRIGNVRTETGLEVRAELGAGQ